MRKALSSLAFLLLLGLALWFPLPFGSVTVVGRLVLEAGGFLALAVALLSDARATSLKAARIPIASCALLFLLGVAQLLPLSASLLGVVSPESEAIVAGSARILALHGREATLPHAISIVPAETREALLQLSAFVSLFAASALLNSDRRRRGLFAGAIILAAVFQVIYGVAAWTGRSDSIFGTRLSTGAIARVRGTFVNPDHLAGYLEICLCVAFGLLYAEILTGSSRTQPGAVHLGAKVEARFFPLALRVFIWLTLFGGLLLTQSRAGALAAILAAGLLVVLAYVRRRSFRFSLLALLAAALSLALAFSAGPIFDRFLGSNPRSISSDSRAQMRAVSRLVQGRFPLFGSGLGTFRDAFLLEQPREMEGLVTHAHNDFVELKTTGGWIGLILGLAALSGMLAALGAAWRRQKHRIESAYALAGIGALGSLAVHALFDFNFAIPAIPATLALALGWSLAAATASEPPNRA